MPNFYRSEMEKNYNAGKNNDFSKNPAFKSLQACLSHINIILKVQPFNTSTRHCPSKILSRNKILKIKSVKNLKQWISTSQSFHDFSNWIRHRSSIYSQNYLWKYFCEWMDRLPLINFSHNFCKTMSILQNYLSAGPNCCVYTDLNL